MSRRGSLICSPCRPFPQARSKIPGRMRTTSAATPALPVTKRGPRPFARQAWAVRRRRSSRSVSRPTPYLTTRSRNGDTRSCARAPRSGTASSCSRGTRRACFPNIRSSTWWGPGPMRGRMRSRPRVSSSSHRSPGIAAATPGTCLPAMTGRITWAFSALSARAACSATSAAPTRSTTASTASKSRNPPSAASAAMAPARCTSIGTPRGRSRRRKSIARSSTPCTSPAISRRPCVSSVTCTAPPAFLAAAALSTLFGPVYRWRTFARSISGKRTGRK